jgi:squalene-hopene/tetraprenyl-beta-curcumene cyclase
MHTPQWIFAVALVGLFSAHHSLASQPDWDRPAAAKYLDDRLDLWLSRASSLPTSEGKAACVSCHTVVPYLLARPALRKAMQIPEPTLPENRLLDNVKRRVEFCFSRAGLPNAKPDDFPAMSVPGSA